MSSGTNTSKHIEVWILKVPIGFCAVTPCSQVTEILGKGGETLGGRAIHEWALMFYRVVSFCYLYSLIFILLLSHLCPLSFPPYFPLCIPPSPLVSPSFPPSFCVISQVLEWQSHSWVMPSPLWCTKCPILTQNKHYLPCFFFVKFFCNSNRKITNRTTMKFGQLECLANGDKKATIWLLS